MTPTSGRRCHGPNQNILTVDGDLAALMLAVTSKPRSDIDRERSRAGRRLLFTLALELAKSAGKGR